MNDHTVDLSLLVMRSGSGGMLVAHGLNKVFGKGGLAGTTCYFAGLGYVRHGCMPASPRQLNSARARS